MPAPATAVFFLCILAWTRRLTLCARLSPARQFAKDGPLLDGDTPYQVALKQGLWDVAEVLKVSEVRRKKLAAGGTRTVPHDTPYWEPPAFSAKRMSAKGTWGVAAGA